jgi:hypothetical protein
MFIFFLYKVVQTYKILIFNYILDALHFDMEEVMNKGYLHRLLQRLGSAPHFKKQNKKPSNPVNLRNRLKMLWRPSSPLDVAILYD